MIEFDVDMGYLLDYDELDKVVLNDENGEHEPMEFVPADAKAGKTCKQEDWSTEGDHARVWLSCGHECMVETVADLLKYCPECGAKVVTE